MPNPISAAVATSGSMAGPRGLAPARNGKTTTSTPVRTVRNSSPSGGAAPASAVRCARAVEMALTCSSTVALASSSSSSPGCSALTRPRRSSMRSSPTGCMRPPAMSGHSSLTTKDT
ncbi:hypothetical protein ACFQ0B_58765 [Nonomuraea thailandensis]